MLEIVDLIRDGGEAVRLREHLAAHSDAADDIEGVQRAIALFAYGLPHELVKVAGEEKPAWTHVVLLDLLTFVLRRQEDTGGGDLKPYESRPAFDTCCGTSVVLLGSTESTSRGLIRVFLGRCLRCEGHQWDTSIELDRPWACGMQAGMYLRHLRAELLLKLY